ncbi:hypothetical protein CISIN_1g030573mg [Citrus sinensis]|uniref:peptidylprolyl isomerase n=1 Tax=Citrus sinensis TaxID=2711 RepID=A0A067EMI4_CITSI|nr:hypothetical protein CISIN_1g030573mg [Citrus sinensis]
MNLVSRRDLIGLVLGVSTLILDSFDAKGAGLPPEEKPRLCDDACEKELENVPMVTTESGLQYKDIKVGQGPSPPVGFQVAANYVAMIPSGQIFDSSLEKGRPYIFRVGSGQVSLFILAKSSRKMIDFCTWYYFIVMGAFCYSVCASLVLLVLSMLLFCLLSVSS